MTAVSTLAGQSFYSAEQEKGNCPLPLQPHPQNQPGPLGEGTTLKPDISLATKSGHFNLLRTAPTAEGLQHAGFQQRATAVCMPRAGELLRPWPEALQRRIQNLRISR